MVIVTCTPVEGWLAVNRVRAVVVLIVSTASAVVWCSAILRAVVCRVAVRAVPCAGILRNGYLSYGEWTREPWTLLSPLFDNMRWQFGTIYKLSTQ